MWRAKLFRRGQNKERFWPENGIVLWCLFLALCCGVGKIRGESITYTSGRAGDFVHTTTAISQPQSGLDEIAVGNSEKENVANNNSEDSNFTKSENETTRHIERFRVAHFDWDHVEIPMILSLTLLVATLAKILFHIQHKLSTLIPESCLLIVVGVLIGLILFYTGFVETDFYQLESDLFFFALLPPIILDAGYFMPQRAFFDNIGTILLYAVVGTLLNTVFLGLSLWGVSFSGVVDASVLPLNLLEILTFAALLSAVDPVAVLAVFEEAHVNEVLYIIVFGESLLNDGVTVVLYHMFEGFTEIGGDNLLAVDIWAGIGSFFVVAGCGTLIGLVFGCLASLMTRVTEHIPVIQPLLVLIMGYLAYVVAEMFHLSGILSCTFCGITMRRYVEANMTRKSHTTTKYFLKLLASVSETIVFMYLGFATVTNTHKWDWAFAMVTLIACLLFRSIVVVALTSLVNVRRLPKLGKVDQFIMSYGGLRGAIAFSLVIVLDENLFENKNLYITTTIFVVYFTNFLMGSTIKPLVKALRVPRADKHKPSLNEQIHSRFIDHLMAGIEDISGQSGHHQLREKFEYFDKNYLQRIFVRRDAVMKKGWSIVSVYDKLNERDAYELLHGNHDYTELFTQLQRDPMTLRNMSFLKLLSSIGNRRNSFSSYHVGSAASFDIGDQTQVDLQALEAQDTRKMRDDSKVHHIVEDVMFMPRKRYTTNRRPVIPSTAKQQQQMHHNARLHLRHLMSHHRDGHHCNGHHNGNHGNGKPKKNVSFAEVTQVASSETDQDVGSTKAESGGGTTDDESTSSENGGITFTATATDNDDDFVEEIPVEPVAVEMSLPWKRNTGREPLTCAVTHSMPDDQHPLIGEAPSWVNNPEYTSPGSPPSTPQPSDGPEPPDSASLDMDSEVNPFTSGPAAESTPIAEGLEMDLISFQSPDHKVLTLEPDREIRHDDKNDNHERTVGETAAVIGAGDSDSYKCQNCTFPPDDQGANAVTDSCPKDELTGVKSSASIQDNNGNPDSSETPPTIQEALPWRTGTSPPSTLPWRTEEYKSEPSSSPWRSESLDEPTSQLPWRSNQQSAPQTIVRDKTPLPWRQNSQDSEDVLPWRSSSYPERESSPQVPLPWRQSSLDTSNDETSSLPWNSKHNKPEENGIHHPKKHLSECHMAHNHHQRHTRSRSDADMDAHDGPPLPWRNNSNVEVKLDQCAPRQPRQASPEPPLEEQSHVPPPPWRHVPEPESSIRSPSATGTFYSLKPQLSSQSFRISEAESKHSEPIHVPHMIDIPHGRPIFDLDGGDAESLELDQEQVDLHERVMLWLMTSEPEPSEVADDLDLELSHSVANNNLDSRSDSPARSGSVEPSTGSIKSVTIHAVRPEAMHL